MSRQQSMEHLLGLPECPQLVDSETDALTEKVYDGLAQLIECSQDEGQCDQIQRVLSDFLELQLCRECQLEECETWGDAWKAYAFPSTPVEHRVRLRLQQASVSDL